MDVILDEMYEFWDKEVNELDDIVKVKETAKSDVDILLTYIKSL